MTEADFAFLRLLLQQRSGLSLTADKRYLAESRLGILCRRRGVADIEALVRQLRLGRDPSLESAVVDAMTTNETLFFRDQTPFNLFRDLILPERLAGNAASRSLRIWCAAVSSGQEAYSLAMLIDELGDRLSGWKIEILGTDISAEILEKARAGIYSQFEIQRGLPIQMLLKHFQQVGDKWQVSQRIRSMVEFRQHNLLERNDQFGRFDVIFCRNVLIYFDVPTKVKVLEQITPRLVPDGAFLLGAAETVLGLVTKLVCDPQHRGLYRHASMAAALDASPAPGLRRRPAIAAGMRG
jgi:chemotaxis protein methyltransferase CheR